MAAAEDEVDPGSLGIMAAITAEAVGAGAAPESEGISDNVAIYFISLMTKVNRQRDACLRIA